MSDPTARDWMQEITTSIISLIIVGSVMTAFAYELIRTGSAANFPDWIPLTLGSVLGFYYGRSTNGKPSLPLVPPKPPPGSTYDVHVQSAPQQQA